MPKYIIQLSPRTWITSGYGDPPRTLIKSNAKVYGSKTIADKMLNWHKASNPNRNLSIAKIVEVIDE